MVEHQPNADTDFSNEMRRKGFHFLSAGIPVGYYLTDYPTALWAVGILLGVSVSVEYLRMANLPVQAWFQRWFGRMLRSSESTETSGATYLLLSAFLAILVFHKDIAILCLLFLIVGDGMAAIVGKRFGRIRLFGKSLEGSLAFALSGVAVSFLFPYIDFSIRLTGVMAAAVAELLPMRTSDNLRIPIISGSVMEVLYVHSLRSLEIPQGGETVVHLFNGVMRHLA